MEEIEIFLADEDWAKEFEEQLLDLLNRLKTKTSNVHKKLSAT